MFCGEQEICFIAFVTADERGWKAGIGSQPTFDAAVEGFAQDFEVTSDTQDLASGLQRHHLMKVGKSQNLGLYLRDRLADASTLNSENPVRNKETIVAMVFPIRGFVFSGQELGARHCSTPASLHATVTARLDFSFTD